MSLQLSRRSSMNSFANDVTRFMQCESNLLGNGSFEYVYKGIFQGGTTFAVKVLNLQQVASKSFDAECEILRDLCHWNLTKVITGCSSNDFKALLLEYMPNGNLKKLLYSDNHALDIMQRLNIMIDVSYTLQYLHHG
ncbi:probable LRR receptor-like serine/threonine-protein kinase At3g47570 [Lycium ferocissimum]|uniref:probable LRR receptor-like serine/threonine-protein kinase At3g47570 n=1 Tax=Lycium ferocissimum TaxID=112874 RepID=UPI002815132B|nr:probable LRR receptor-like serine/threonine-protein kinase At3g47570 [Lycium ferocissimum]